MRINQIQYIVEVAKCHSFSKAAKKLFIAQPTLSMAISALEEELGVTIFYRTPRGAFLTEDGEILVSQAEQILAIMDQMSNIGNKNDARYTVSIAAIPVACNSLTTKLLKRLSMTHPEIKLNIIEMRPPKIINMLADGTVDIVIGFYSERKRDVLDEAAKSNLHIEPVLTDQLYAFVERNHPVALKKSACLKDFEHDFQAIFENYRLLNEDEAHDAPSDDCYTFSDRSSIKQAVAEGLAYAIFPHQMVLDDVFVKAGLIQAVPLEDVNNEITTYLAWRKGTYTPKQVTIVLDLIRELYIETAQRLENLTTLRRNQEVKNSVTRY